MKNLWGVTKFIVMIRHEDGAAFGVSGLMKRKGFKVYDFRKADMVDNETNEVTGSVYLIYCEGSVRNYKKFRDHNNYDEIIYEGLKCLM